MEEIKDVFSSYRRAFEEALQEAVVKMGNKSVLRDACAYCILSGGKRIRPLLVFFVNEALDLGGDVMPSALAVEFFHTASLIADDLPCMDDESERRGQPTLHKAYGETTALLASYAFISAGYEQICKNGSVVLEKGWDGNRLCKQAIEEVSHCAGLEGATGGQFLDLFPPDNSLETIQKIIYQKTSTLFQVAFALGWIFGGGDLALLGEVREISHHLGMAFQIADDLADLSQDKTNQSQINLPLVIGKKKAVVLLEEETEKLQLALKKLHLWTSPFQILCKTLLSAKGLF